MWKVIQALKAWIDLWSEEVLKQAILNCFFLMAINIGNPLLINELRVFSPKDIKKKIWWIKYHKKVF